MSTNKLAEALTRAQQADPDGKRATYRIGDFRITLAKETSANPGYLYIRSNTDGYQGKIDPEGHLLLVNPNTTAEVRNLLNYAVKDPEMAARVDGRKTGVCSCCGRQLTNPLSVELGIGPICRGGWFPAPSSDQLTLESLGELKQESPLPIPNYQTEHEDWLESTLISPEGLTPTSDVLDEVPYPFTATDAKAETKLEIDDILEAYSRLDAPSKVELLSRITLMEITTS